MENSNRTIKFRAWDKVTNRMRDVNVLFWNGDCDMQLWANEKDKKDWDNSNDGWYERSNTEAILMQYTGLKDKNGVEIYEGDIILIDTEIFEVFWSEYGKWTFENENGMKEFNDIEGLEISLKVIGNIYENSDFLN